MNKNKLILIVASLLAVLLFFFKFKNTENFQSNNSNLDQSFDFKNNFIKGRPGRRGLRGKRGLQGPKGVPGGACNNIISQLENRGYLNLGIGQMYGYNNTQLELNGTTINTNKPFYKLKISNYKENDFPLMIGNNINDYSLYIKKKTSGVEMKLNGNMHIIGNLKIVNNNKLYNNRYKNETSLFFNLCPVGIICAYGERNIPECWAICDGTTKSNGFQTPDLKGRFIKGANSVDEIGINNDDVFDEYKTKDGKIIVRSENLPRHTHSIGTQPPHGHVISGTLSNNSVLSSETGNSQYGIAIPGSGNQNLIPVNSQQPNSQHNHDIDAVGNNQEIDINPPYYTLVYIIKYK